jgi:hypothetical protein
MYLVASIPVNRLFAYETDMKVLFKNHDVRLHVMSTVISKNETICFLLRSQDRINFPINSVILGYSYVMFIFVLVMVEILNALGTS